MCYLYYLIVLGFKKLSISKKTQFGKITPNLRFILFNSIKFQKIINSGKIKFNKVAPNGTLCLS